MAKVRDPSTPCLRGDVHDVVPSFEDATTVQGTCRDCGADIAADKAEPGFGS